MGWWRHTSAMKTNPGLKFIIIIAVTLCAAITLRVFAAGKRYQEQHAPFRLVIEERTEMKQGTTMKKAKDLVKNGINCDMDFKESASETSLLTQLCGPTTTAKRGEGKAGGPHIQQKVEFTKVSDLKALVAALTTPSASAKPAPGTSAPEGSPSPAPHVSQQVEAHTPQAANAIAAALRR